MLTLNDIAQALLPSWRLATKNDDEAARQVLMGVWEDIHLAAAQKNRERINPPFSLPAAMAQAEAQR